MPWPVEATAQRALSQTQKYPLAGTSRPRPPTPTGGCPRPPPRLTPGHRSRRPPRQLFRSFRLHRHSRIRPLRLPRRRPLQSGQPTPLPRQRPLPSGTPPRRRQSQRPASSRPGRRRPPDPTPTPTTTGDPRATRTLRRSTRNRPWTGTRRPRPCRVPPGRPPSPHPPAKGRPRQGVQARRPRSPRPLSRLPRRRTPPTTRGPVQLKRLPESGRSAPVPMSGATRRRSQCHPSRRRSRNRRITSPRRPRSRTTPQQCRRPPHMSPWCPRRTAGATPPSWYRPALQLLQPRQALRPSPRPPLQSRQVQRPSPRPPFHQLLPLKLRPRQTRRRGKAFTSGCPTARKPRPDGPRLRPGPQPPPTSRTSRARTTKRSRNRACSDGPPSNVSWAESWLKSGHWTEARCRRASNLPAGPSARHHPKRTRTLCTKVQFKS